MIKLEHANLSVTDVDAHTRFITAALPEFSVRGQGVDDAGRPWRHVGNQHFYIALQAVRASLALAEQSSAVPANPQRAPYGNTSGLNHLGWEVDDVAALERRMSEAGFTANAHHHDHPARRRVYFHDPDGNDWEFVQYLTDDPAARNDYER